MLVISLFFSFLVQCIENKQLYFAERLNDAMKVLILPYLHMSKCGCGIKEETIS